MLEKDIITKIKEFLKKELGIIAHKHHGGPYSENGVPDLFGTLPGGRAFFFEVKTPTTINQETKQKIIQRRWMETEAKAGALTGFVCSVEDVRKLINS